MVLCSVKRKHATSTTAFLILCVVVFQILFCAYSNEIRQIPLENSVAENCVEENAVSV